MKTQIQFDLPNFPSEVITSWIEPFAKTEGWPPDENDQVVPSNRWRYLLIKRPLSFWKSIKWNKLEFHLSANALSELSLESVTSLVLGAKANQVNLFTQSIPDFRERFERASDYLKSHLVFPEPPIILNENEVYHILDGNHRIAAYLYGYGYFKLPLDNDMFCKVKENQIYWVAQQ